MDSFLVNCPQLLSDDAATKDQNFLSLFYQLLTSTDLVKTLLELLASSIVSSQSFTFLVGPGHTKLTIQSGLAKHVSQPLHDLMNNGHTRESRHHIAVLEEEDVETFVGFCEFAYTGDYTVPPRQSPTHERKGSYGTKMSASPVVDAVPPQAPSPPATPRGDQQESNEKPAGEDTGGNQPRSAPDDEGDNKGHGSGKKGKKNKKDKTRGGSKSITEDTATLTPPRTPPLMVEGDPDGKSGQQDADEKLVTESAVGGAGPADWFDFEAPKTVDIDPPSGNTPSQGSQQHNLLPALFPKGTNLWDDFTSLEYVHHQHRSVAALPSPIQDSVSGYGASNVPYLLFHAKLYAFATRYLIPTLAQLSLVKLHQDLLKFPLGTNDNVDENQNAIIVLDLLHYTFTNTKRVDPVFSQSEISHYAAKKENQLRKLVVHYAACKVRELASYRHPSTDSALPPTTIGSGRNVQPAATSLRALLDCLGELASDLVYRMM